MKQATIKADIGEYNKLKSQGFKTVWCGNGLIHMRKTTQ